MDRQDWSEALAAQDGGPPMPAYSVTHIHVPAGVRSEGDRIVYRDWLGLPPAQRSKVAPTWEMLRDFSRLGADLDGDAIGDFAARWGPLRTCACGDGIHPGCRPLALPGTEPNAWPLSGTYYERTATWRGLAWEVAALLNIHAAISCDERPDPVDVGLLDASLDFALPSFLRGSEDARRSTFALAINCFVMKAGVRPQLSHDGNTGLGFDGLLGALGAQLLSTVGTPLVFCSGCGERIKQPSRKRRKGLRAWCAEPACRAAASKARVARWRLRNGADRVNKRVGGR